MRKEIDIGPKKKKFVGPAKKGEIRNPAGKPKGAGSGKPPLPARLSKWTKSNILEVFKRSQALSVLNCYLNMKIPPQLRPLHHIAGQTTITPREDAAIKAHLERNFKWAFELIAKMMPKELSVSGSIDHTFTIAGATKRAMVEDKSDNVIDLVRKRKERELYEVDE